MSPPPGSTERGRPDSSRFPAPMINRRSGTEPVGSSLPRALVNHPATKAVRYADAGGLIDSGLVNDRVTPGRGPAGVKRAGGQRRTRDFRENLIRIRLFPISFFNNQSAGGEGRRRGYQSALPCGSVPVPPRCRPSPPASLANEHQLLESRDFPFSHPVSSPRKSSAPTRPRNLCPAL